ncbi:methyltransferase [Lichenifustis flavocetrariae]|uniref:Acetylserotonin O-methyltransferase n=1 Tax=Lichenifustis flavocetrariae TaxID=2949735 RepID=A0AA41YYM3_9HYPH|nr:methyltransferase [Lichenifustis flavocetrariae]MCW6507283.1 acetylserotonin O-methyltransferase [Lichenifustis flavocetrariae]
MTTTALGLPALRDWQAWRDRLLASARFQRWAIRFPPTRWIARRRARTLFDLCAGFVYSQVLFACVKLGIFEQLSKGPQSLAALARHSSLSEDATRRLLEAARSLELVEIRKGELYGLGALGAALRGNPGVAAMIAHHQALYADLADPVALLRGASTSHDLASYWPYSGRPHPRQLTADDTDPYTTLMGQTQAMIAAEVLQAHSFTQHRVLLDVGGGDGSFLMAVAAQAPKIRLMLFDLPPVAERARLRLSGAGLATRATVTGGDFRVDPLPEGADIVTLVRVIHDHNDDTALAILQAVRHALPSNGTLILAEPMADTRGAEPIGHAYFGFYLLAMGQGRPRSRAELTALLHLAGFGTVNAVKTGMPMLTSVLIAHLST